ncbi:MAG: ABC transporter substrate-binding protein [Spirochaetaceae bacterium]|jgi:NitT/TauT family transport system substrate-binding protein|nr:ABC transporter substrate-binding protein [Spirochaetaceae bacterium]
MKKLVIFCVAVVIGAGSLYANGQKAKTEAGSEQSRLRISKQYGVNYLPLIVLEGQKLIEKNAKEAGLGDITVEWVTFGGGATANDALLSGSVDLISGGIAPFVRLWDKTNGNVKSLGTLDQSPLILNTSNPAVYKLADLTEKDKIAVPSVKVSIQALVLQVAAAKEFGKDNYDKIDHLTVALSHPDALVALTSGKSEITAHFTNEPYASLEQQTSGIHFVFDSYGVFGARHSTNLVSTTADFYNNNPKLSAVILKSLNEADAWIAANKREAARLYLEVTKSNEPLELVLQIISRDEITYTTKPLNVTFFSDFLYDTGAISRKPVQDELFFPIALDTK